ncbi:MAG TPA: hypothetical protein VIT65_10780 [Microlunatus sp.]
MAIFTPCRWQDQNTGSAWISASAFSTPSFEQALARVNNVNDTMHSNAWFVGRWDDVAQEWVPVSPVEGVDRCECGAKYWDGLRCHSCGALFQTA